MSGGPLLSEIGVAIVAITEIGKSEYEVLDYEMVMLVVAQVAKVLFSSQDCWKT